MADLADDIEAAATAPSTVTTDGLTVAAVPIPDQIAADQYVTAKRKVGSNSAWGGAIRPAKVILPGVSPGGDS